MDAVPFPQEDQARMPPDGESTLTMAEKEQFALTDVVSVCAGKVPAWVCMVTSVFGVGTVFAAREPPDELAEAFERTRAEAEELGGGGLIN